MPQGQHWQVGGQSCGLVLCIVQELWLQHNPVTDLAQVQALEPVTALQQLWLQPCPLHASLGEQYRPAVVSALPSLQVRQGSSLVHMKLGRLHCCLPCN